MLLGYGYMRNSLVHLGEYPTYQDVADVSNLFYYCSVYIWSRVMKCLPKSPLSKRNGMNKNRYKHFRQPVERKIMQMRMCQFKLTKSLSFFGHEHVSSRLRWNRFYVDTKILLSQTAYWDIFPYKHPATMSS